VNLLGSIRIRNRILRIGALTCVFSCQDQGEYKDGSVTMTGFRHVYCIHALELMMMDIGAEADAERM
jgi:hypothetical protein